MAERIIDLDHLLKSIAQTAAYRAGRQMITGEIKSDGEQNKTSNTLSIPASVNGENGGKGNI